MFQTDDDGRVGNVLMGYASLMVLDNCLILIIDNTNVFMCSVLPAQVWLPRGAGGVAAGKAEAHISGIILLSDWLIQYNTEM